MNGSAIDLMRAAFAGAVIATLSAALLVALTAMVQTDPAFYRTGSWDVTASVLSLR
ncbi:MAG: hypothetical protein WDN31_11595 [Hyphomicrobium sp.]